MLFRSTKGDLVKLTKALNALPPPLPDGTRLENPASALLSSGTPPPLANWASLLLTTRGVDVPTLKSAVQFAIHEKLATLQKFCVALSVGALLLAVIIYVSAEIGSFLLLLIYGVLGYAFVGGIVAAIVAAIVFSKQKHTYAGTRADFNTVQRLGNVAARVKSEDIY